MTTKYDQSGKTFSHVISKEPVQVVIRTKTSRIEGKIYKKYDERVIDALNEDAEFIAVSDVTFYEIESGVENTRKVEFAVVNRTAIEWLLPLES